MMGLSGFLEKYLYVMRGQEWKLATLIAMYLLMAFLDIMGIGLVGPFVGTVVNPTLVEKITLVRWIFAQLNMQPGSLNAVLVIGGFLIILFILKFLIAVSIQFRVYRFSFHFRAELIERLMRAYLHMPYRFFLERNSASIVQAIVNHTKVMVDDLLLPSLRICSDSITIIIIFSFLCWISVTAVASLGCMLVIAALIYIRFVRPRVIQAGQISAQENELVIRGVNEGIGGIKEIKVLRVESFMTDTVTRAAHNTARAHARFYTMLQAPRSMMEVVLILFVVLFSLLAIGMGEAGESLMPILATFGVASLRILPSAISASASIASMSYSSHALISLYEDLRSVESTSTRTIPSQPVPTRTDFEPFRSLEIQDLSYAYPGASRKAIDGISLRITKGQSVGLIGESGAGKTTLIDILLGLHPFDSGRMRINDQDIETFAWPRWLDQVAYIPQSPFLADDTLARNVAFGVSDALVDPKRLDDAIRAAQLETLLTRLANGYATVLGDRGIRLSGGERQRIALARAFYHNRDVFIFDEATSALDMETERQVIEVINQLHGEKTLIVIAHRLATVQACDVIYRMRDGKVVASGTFAEVVNGE
ncbi:MAG: ABC transporter ATP-binding protein/permease [Magnetococcus sp. YQC-9]